MQRSLLFAALALSVTVPARAEPKPQAPGFFCLGESESLMRGSTLDEMRAERDLRLQQLDAGKVAPELVAHTHCVVAELMRKLGDARAAQHYEAAIAQNPSEPAYELWYGRYYQWSRGASSPLTESAERHYYRALEKLETHEGVTNVGSTNATAREWTQHNLALSYQEDGLPLLPLDWKAFPYGRDASWAPQLSLSVSGSFARDTTDFWEATDTRRFTQELQAAVERRQAGGPRLTPEEIAAIARTSDRWDTLGRLRLRQSILGVLDGHYRRAELLDSQINDSSQPTERNDVKLEELGLHWRRGFDLYPALDLMLDAGYTVQQRTGVVEGDPEREEDVKIAQLSGSISRFLGPDKLTLGGSYVHFDIPSSTGAGPASTRERVIRAAFVDYAIYRPLLLPQLQKGTFAAERKPTRGWHWFAAAVLDDERFGRSILRKGTYSGGTAFKGWLDYNVTLTGQYLTSALEDNGRVDEDQDSAQWRTALTVTRRLIDEEANPGLPAGPLASLQLAVPIRHDVAVKGLTEYENVRGGVELWGKLFSGFLRGSSVLVNVGVDYQYFYNIDKGLVSARVEARLGWPTFGNIPTFF